MHVRHKRIATKKGLVPERFRDQPLVGYAFIAAPGLASSIGSVPAPRLGAGVGGLMP